MKESDQAIGLGSTRGSKKVKVWPSGTNTSVIV